MADWRNYTPIPNRHELTIPNGPEIVLYEYKSGYRVQITYKRQEPTESTIKNPKVSLSTELIYTADDLGKAKEYAAMLANMMFQKAINQLKVARNHTEFYTQDERPDEPSPFEDVDPGSILWTDDMVTNKKVRDQTATHLMETNMPARQQILKEIKQERTDRYHELFSKLNVHEYPDHDLVTISETEHRLTHQTVRHNQVEYGPTLGYILTELTPSPERTTIVYFQDGDVHVRQTSDLNATHSVMRLMKTGRNAKFHDRIQGTTIDGISGIDDITIKLESIIRDVLGN